MKVLIIAELADETRASLASLGLDIDYAPETAPHALPARIGDARLLVTGRTRVSRNAIEAAQRLEGILRAGLGTEGIDVQAASERGITVADCGEVDAHARAELALGAMIALDRGLRRGPLPAFGLRGRTLGIHCWDASALPLAHAARSLGMHVTVHARALTPTLAAEMGLHWSDTQDALYRRSDILSLHPERSGDLLATRERLALLHDDATLIDVAGRGHIDLEAAKTRLEAGTLRLALDGYDESDYGEDVPFAHDHSARLLATFREAVRTAEVDDAIAHHVVAALQHFLEHRALPNARNLAASSRATRLVIRHVHGPELVAAIFEVLKDAGVVFTDLHSERLSGGQSAILTIGLATPLARTTRDDLAGLAGVFGVEV
jgi:D-3-phosphoglycerate dehydrogenase